MEVDYEGVLSLLSNLDDGWSVENNRASVQTTEVISDEGTLEIPATRTQFSDAGKQEDWIERFRATFNEV